MSTPTEEQIKHLQSLLDAGTPGEWISERSRFDEFPVIRDTKNQAIALMDSGGCTFSYEMMKANSDLTADLHNLAPALLEAARENLRLRERNRFMMQALEELNSAPWLNLPGRAGDIVEQAIEYGREGS